MSDCQARSRSLAFSNRFRLCGLLLAFFVIACDVEPGVQPASAGGVRAYRVESRDAEPARGIEVGDFVLANRTLRFVIAGKRSRAGVAPGTIKWAERTQHPLIRRRDPFEPVVRAEGEEVVLLDPVFEIRLRAGAPAIQLQAWALSRSGLGILILREYSIDSISSAIAIRTRLEAFGRQTVSGVESGARIPWVSGSPFVPGTGVVNESGEVRGRWVGAASEGVAHAYAAPSRDSRFEFSLTDHANTRTSGETLALGPSTDLEPRESFVSRARYFMVPGDLGDIARVVAASRNEPLVETSFRATVLGSFERDVTIEVEDLIGRPVLVADLPLDVPRSLYLAPGEYRARALAPGHSPSPSVRFVARGSTQPIPLVIPRGGRIRVSVRDGENYRELPARIVVRGIGSTLDPMLGPLHSAGGAGTIVIAASGTAEFEVPSGNYELTASHGPEWTIAKTRVEVTPTRSADFDAVLIHSVPMTDWTACDLHVHARPSPDSSVTPMDRVASLVSEGIEFATPSEHNIVGDYGDAVLALPPAASSADGGPGLVWVPSVEVTTDRAPTPLGHFNLYPFLPYAGVEHGGPPPFDALPAEIFRLARANNPEAIVQINHPRLGGRLGYFDQTELDPTIHRARSRSYDPGYDAIEVFNGLGLASPESVRAVMVDWFALLNTGARYVGTASSDSHTIAYHAAGYPRTYAYTPGAGNRAPDASTVLASIRAGRVFGTSGPMLFLTIDDAMPGDTIHTAEASLRAKVEVRTAPWVTVEHVEVFRDGERVATAEIPATRDGVRWSGEFEVPLRAARGYVSAVVSGSQTMNDVLPHLEAVPFAFTNPIWIERVAAAHPPRNPRRSR